MNSTTARRVTALEWELFLRDEVSRLAEEDRDRALAAARKVKVGDVIGAHKAILASLPDAALLAILRGLEESLGLPPGERP